MVTPQAVILIKFVTNAFTLGCAVFRFLVLRGNERGGGRTLRSTLCHVLLFTAWGMDFSATSMAAYVATNEIKYIRAGDSPAEVERKLLLPVNLKVFYYAHLMYYLSLCTIRAAYLVFYSGLYSRLVTRRRYALYAAGAVCACVYIAAILILFLWCHPFVDNWNPQASNPHCPSLFDPPAFVALAVMNIVADLAVLVVPILMLSSFRFGRVEKASLALIFCIGGTSIIASVARLGVVYELLAEEVFTWHTMHVFSLWSHAEVFFGVMAFTLPSFRYLLKGLFARFEASSNVNTRCGARLTTTITNNIVYGASFPDSSSGGTAVECQRAPSKDSMSSEGSEDALKEDYMCGNEIQMLHEWAIESHMTGGQYLVKEMPA